MSHYFQNDENVKSNPKVVAFRVLNTQLNLWTDHGVFSKNGLDIGTLILLKNIPEISYESHVLDLGCGVGIIGIYLAKIYGCQMTMSDINKRAVGLTQKNIEINKVEANVIESDGFDSINNLFDVIVTNPPIRIGKKSLYELLSQAVNHLRPKGSMYLVISKKHGLNSMVKFLTSLGDVLKLGHESGFHVLEFIKRLDE
jgi:16S rRNA (guanine1207-N2)-methyltransferase